MVSCPKLERIEASASTGAKPNALSTCEGSVMPGVSGRDGPFQLRIRAGSSDCVLTEGIGAFEVWLCSTLHHEAGEAI